MFEMLFILHINTVRFSYLSSTSIYVGVGMGIYPWKYSSTFNYICIFIYMHVHTYVHIHFFFLIYTTGGKWIIFIKKFYSFYQYP